jgi:hypothetical protein
MEIRIGDLVITGEKSFSGEIRIKLKIAVNVTAENVEVDVSTKELIAAIHALEEVEK